MMRAVASSRSTLKASVDDASDGEDVFSSSAHKCHDLDGRAASSLKAAFLPFIATKVVLIPEREGASHVLHNSMFAFVLMYDALASVSSSPDCPDHNHRLPCTRAKWISSSAPPTSWSSLASRCIATHEESEHRFEHWRPACSLEQPLAVNMLN